MLAVRCNTWMPYQELPIEVTRAELTIARTQERLVRLQDRDEILTEQIRNLTGTPEGQPVEVETVAPGFTNDQAENETVSLAVQNDRDIQEAENERAARERIFRGAHLSYWPTVDLVGQYSVLSKFNNYGEFYKKFERNNLNVGVVLTIPLFASKTGATVALAKSQLDVAEATVSKKRQEVRLDVVQKSRSVRELDAAREVARLDLKLAQETVQLAQARFDQGRVTLQEIEQDRLDESDKWIAFLDADFAREQAQLTLLQAQENLRKEISRELHDKVVQLLVGININLEAFSRMVEINPQGVRRKVIPLRQLVEDAVQTVHQFARDLRPTALDDLGLVPALNSYLKDYSKRTGLKVGVTASAGIEALDNDKLTMLYRVAQEALTNVEKHAEASAVKVVILRARGGVSLEVIDDGRAFDVDRFSNADVTHRLGLTSMRERVEMLGGRFGVVSTPGVGTTVRAEVSIGKKKVRK